MVQVHLGNIRDCFRIPTLQAYLAEFIATLLFVFAGLGSAVAYSKLTSGAALDPAGLVIVALAHGLALFVGVSMAAKSSGGHLNPAVTFGLVWGGHVTVISSIFYVHAQLLGSVAGCFLLKYITGEAIPTHGLADGVTPFRGVLLEFVTTFALVYVIYATVADPKKGDLGSIAPLAIGLTVAANILVAGPFSGGSMNPARSFGPAIVNMDFSQHWIYWVGPIVGGSLGGLIYLDVNPYAQVPVPEKWVRAAEEYERLPSSAGDI